MDLDSVLGVAPEGFDGQVSYAPRNILKISHLRHLRINLRIKLAEFMRYFFYYPSLYFDSFWAGPPGELSGNPPHHTFGNTKKNFVTLLAETLNNEQIYFYINPLNNYNYGRKKEIRET